MIEKKDYIMKQLHRTHNKKFENYVITRIWHLLNDLDIKIITQQYIRRNNDNYSIVDLYFPQFDLYVEVDETYHIGNKLNDRERERDIINITNFEPYHIDADDDIESIHNQIDKLVELIKMKKAKNSFKKWDYENEFDNKQYIDKGFIDVSDKAVFKKSVDAVNCFGFNDKALMRGGKNHKYEDNVLIWFPKLYEHGDWNNVITLDENTIYENHIDPNENKKYIKKWIEDPRNVRYCFAHSKDDLGRTLYRFKGEYTLNKKKTIEMQKAVWERTNLRVQTFKNN